LAGLADKAIVSRNPVGQRVRVEPFSTELAISRIIMTTKNGFITGWLGLHFLVLSLALAEPAGQPVLFSDSFQNKMADGWKWVHPVDGNSTLSEDGLRIKSLPGTLWLTSNNAKNLLLRPAPATNKYSISATVTSDPKRNGEQGGLLLYVDDDNYIKVVREFFQGQLHLIFAREEEGKGEGIRYLPNTQNPVVLRLVVKDSVVTASYRSPEAKDWIELGTCASLKRVPQTGLFTHGGDAQADRRVRYNSFEIRAAE
jgi:regulation of enolase protein 1 (concanavalin A-like superfamily)